MSAGGVLRRSTGVANNRSQVKQIGIFLGGEARHLRRSDAGATDFIERSVEVKDLRLIYPIGIQRNVRHAAACGTA